MEQLQQQTPAWFRMRLGRFTASQIHKLISKKGFTQTANSYVMEKVTEEIIGYKEDFQNMAMVWGNDHEAEARELYELITNQTVEEVGFVEFGAEAGGSPDGLVDEEGMIEIKCPYNSQHHLVHGLIETVEDVPKEYFWQMQMNMMAANRTWCDFVSYDPRCKLKIFIHRLHADEDAFEKLKAAIEVAVEKKEAYIAKLTAER
jgi:putative phage-type endonuclease